MEEKIISALNEDELWNKVSAELSDDSLQYHAILKQDNNEIIFDVDIDPGGGFEGGYALTSFSAKVLTCNHFKFAIHKEDFIDELGKFFGMEDILLGFKNFDEKLIVKTNDTDRLKHIFSNQDVRDTILSLNDFTFQISHHKENDEPVCYLELDIEEGILEIKTLKSIYSMFKTVLNAINSNSI